ncbi:ATP-binding protein [Paenibacillus sp. GD4]|jgi:serine/threonine-protein kinase RsbW|uniref:ATP-binding protein n=1 Tax=Paenibacillus sp. GD4 TaxID=3068890 RepID=UPI002796CBD8|nr:ATP-binding protein [Paenibacillus sp. GD4]MDQ1910583.1 ATP-binding protein [Paenibacillus sp. GD4]
MSPDLKGKDVVLKVPAMPAYLDTIRLVLYGTAAQMGFSYEAIEDMKVAVTEACTHALLQLEPGKAGELRLTLERSRQELRMRIQHEGEPVTYGKLGAGAGLQDGASAVPFPNVMPGLPPETEGLGLFLMQSLVDEVTVLKLEGGAEEVVLCKRRE